MAIQQIIKPPFSIAKLEIFILTSVIIFQLFNAIFQISFSIIIYKIYNLCDNQALIYGLNATRNNICLKNFLLISSLAPISDDQAFTVYDYWNMASILYIYCFLIFILSLTIKKYVDSVSHQKNETKIFLFTLQISNFRTEKEIHDFSLILSIIDLQSEILKKVVHLSEIKKVDNKSDITSIRMQDELIVLETQTNEQLINTREEKTKRHFKGRAYMTFNSLNHLDLIVSLYERSILYEYLQKMLNDLTITDAILLSKLGIITNQSNILEINNGFKHLVIKQARETEEINWEELKKQDFTSKINYFVKIIKQEKVNLLFLIGYLGMTVGIFCFVYYLKYFGTISYFEANFLSLQADINISFFDMTFQTTFKAIGFDLLIALCPWIIIKIIRFVLSTRNFCYYSSLMNLSFILEVIYNITYQIIGPYYGYKNAALDFRSTIASSFYPELFYSIHSQFLITAAFGFGTALIQYILIFIVDFAGRFFKKVGKQMKNCFEKAKKDQFSEKKQQKRVENEKKKVEKEKREKLKKIENQKREKEIQHSTFFANLSVYFFWLSFYQNVISPAVQLIMIVFLILNALFCFISQDKVEKNNKYLSFSHLTFVLSFFGFVLSIGGVFSYDTIYIFSYRYFTQISYSDNFFPLSLITCITGFLMYIPIFLVISKKKLIAKTIVKTILSSEKKTRIHTQNLEDLAYSSNYDRAEANFR